MTPVGPCALNPAHEGPFEGHHVGARENDPDTEVRLCRPCHKAITDLQWRLGILRRNEHRQPHGSAEREWAQIEGLLLLMQVGGEPSMTAEFETLSRAEGIVASLAAEVGDEPIRWGPKPAWNPATFSPPMGTDTGDPGEILRLLGTVGEQVTGDPLFASLALSPERVALLVDLPPTDDPAYGPGYLPFHVEGVDLMREIAGSIGSTDDVVALFPRLGKYLPVAVAVREAQATAPDRATLLDQLAEATLPYAP